jgi:SAM-dependent methyltransferase
VRALYDAISDDYATQRRTDLRIAAPLWTALEGVGSVLNVGAGTGSYEPSGHLVIAVEPSSVMLARRARDVTPRVQGRAEELPFKDKSVDAVMAVLTLHHWSDQRRGLGECGRVARDRVVVLTWDPSADSFWLVQDYFPELLAIDRVLFPSIEVITAALGDATVIPIPIPSDCVDGFLGAYWQRPASYLDARVRGGMSSFNRIASLDAGLERLASDLRSGLWRRRYGWLLGQDALDIGYRLVVSSCRAS